MDLGSYNKIASFYRLIYIFLPQEIIHFKRKHKLRDLSILFYRINVSMSAYITGIIGLSRPKKIALQLFIDASLIAFSLFFALFLRLETFIFFGEVDIWLILFTAELATLVAFSLLGLYRSIVRYVTSQVLMTVAKGVLISVVVLYISIFFFDFKISKSVPITYSFLVFLSIGGTRFFIRQVIRNPKYSNKRSVIIYGAGQAGLQLLTTLVNGREYAPLALVDDDESLQGLVVGGLKVYGPDEISALVKNTGLGIILLAIPSLGRKRRNEIIKSLESKGIEIKTVPSMSEIISGRAKISEIRTVSPEDLLRRDPVSPNLNLMSQKISQKVVMVSGAGGSIGSELCRQIVGQKPKIVILYEISEFGLYKIEDELVSMAQKLNHDIRIIPILGSILNKHLLRKTISEFNVETIYHAAAYKHVPLLESNVVEAVQNNVFGTLIISSAAREQGVSDFILISTDKAVRPTNVMGATKRIAELICQMQAVESITTIFSMVRFGNVLGSSGSVIPKFRSQIEAGGPITITHPEIRRYFMTIPEAAQLVIQAGAMAKGGEVFVLDMGEPVKIIDLAISMVKLLGLTPYVLGDTKNELSAKGDIPIVVTGLRKGEKLYEELLIEDNSTNTLHPLIKSASEKSMESSKLISSINTLEKAMENFDLIKIFNILEDLPLDYRRQKE